MRGDEHVNKNNRKGFTLAELLIVVAIIAVLVAISIPIFHAQLRKARLAANQANGRAAFSAAEAAYLDYVAEHGSIKANSKTENYDSVTYTYFPAAGKGILNFQISPGANQWIVSSGKKICTNTDVSSWNVDTIICAESGNDIDPKSVQIGDKVATVWTIHMDKSNGSIKGYNCAFPSTDNSDYKKVLNDITIGDISSYEHYEP